MRLPIYCVCFAVAAIRVSGQASVRTAAQLADAIRAGERTIRLDSTVTGHSNDELSPIQASEHLRYSDFPEVR